MRRRRGRMGTLALLGGLLVATGLCVGQQQSEAPKDEAPSSKKDQGPVPGNRLTIEVTGGDANKPVDNASVYVKTVEEHLLKDKKSEINVKTNPKGIAHVPDAPMGKVLVQVVADGWKPYGHWFEVTEQQHVIKVHLERPPKWY